MENTTSFASQVAFGSGSSFSCLGAECVNLSSSSEKEQSTAPMQGLGAQLVLPLLCCLEPLYTSVGSVFGPLLPDKSLEILCATVSRPDCSLSVARFIFSHLRVAPCALGVGSLSFHPLSFVLPLLLLLAHQVPLVSCWRSCCVLKDLYHVFPFLVRHRRVWWVS